MSQEKVIDIRGRRLGGATPLICTPLVGKTAERVLAEAASVVTWSAPISRKVVLSSGPTR